MAKRGSSLSLQTLGRTGLWLTLGLYFLAVGLQQLTPYGADAIRPFALHSPFLAWAWRLLGAHGASAVLGVVEILIGLGLLSNLARPGGSAARAGAAGAALSSLVSASFLLTGPGAFIAWRHLPLLSMETGQLFAKDLILFAACLLLLGEG